MGPSDTSPEAEAFLLVGCRRMPPTEKLRRVASLNRALTQLAAARIRAQYGNVSEEMRLWLGVLRLGAPDDGEGVWVGPGGGRVEVLVHALEEAGLPPSER